MQMAGQKLPGSDRFQAGKAKRGKNLRLGEKVLTAWDREGEPCSLGRAVRTCTAALLDLVRGVLFRSLARSPVVPRTLFCCAALLVCSPLCRAESSVTPTEMLIRLTVRPMAAPKPALRYLLLPE